MRLIDANARIEEIRKAHCSTCDNYGGVRCRSCWVDDGIGFLEDAPTVDAVEVVRCKDCKHCRVASWGERYCIRDKTVEWGDLKEDDFCSYGERRNDD